MVKIIWYRLGLCSFRRQEVSFGLQLVSSAWAVIEPDQESIHDPVDLCIKEKDGKPSVGQLKLSKNEEAIKKCRHSAGISCRLPCRKFQMPFDWHTNPRGWIKLLVPAKTFGRFRFNDRIDHNSSQDNMHISILARNIISDA